MSNATYFGDVMGKLAAAGGLDALAGQAMAAPPSKPSAHPVPGLGNRPPRVNRPMPKPTPHMVRPSPSRPNPMGASGRPGPDMPTMPRAPLDEVPLDQLVPPPGPPTAMPGRSAIAQGGAGQAPEQNFPQRVGNTIGNAASTVGSGLVRGAEWTGNRISDAFNWATGQR